MPVATERRHAGEAIENFLEASLRSGDFAPGSRLPTERALSERLKLPRSTVRAALARFEAQGRIVRMIGSGTYVSNSPVGIAGNPQDQIEASPLEIMETRLLVEPQLAGLVVAHATNRDLDQLQRCIDNAEAAQALGDFEIWDAKLHQAIADATHNRLIIAIYASITAARDQAEWGELKKRSLSVERRDTYQRHHRAIVQALRSRDAVTAELALRTHLLEVRHNMLGL